MDRLRRLQLVLVLFTFFWLSLALIYSLGGILEAVQLCIVAAVLLAIGSFVVAIIRVRAKEKRE
jgi:hypothetical protein